MTLNIFIRSIFIAFLVAIPAPFLVDWLTGLTEVGSGAVTYFGVYLLVFLGCLIMGATGLASSPVSKNVAGSAADEYDDRESGTVKWFNVTKGFGFITRDSGEDVFVHYRSVRGRGRRTLREGQRVLFQVTEGDKGLQAEDVSPADS